MDYPKEQQDMIEQWKEQFGDPSSPQVSELCRKIVEEADLESNSPDALLDNLSMLSHDAAGLLDNLVLLVADWNSLNSHKAQQVELRMQGMREFGTIDLSELEEDIREPLLQLLASQCSGKVLKEMEVVKRSLTRVLSVIEKLQSQSNGGNEDDAAAAE